jgi:AcrR family transcriptional regulator
MARPNVSEARKQQILAAAAQVFVRDGLDAARMEDVAQEAGLSVGGVYWYFKGKEAVVQALLEEMFDADLSGLRGVVAADGSVHERLAAYVRASLTETAPQSPLSNELYSLATRNDAARAHLLAYLGEFQRLLADLIQQGIDRGELRPVDPRRVALALIALYEGFTELAMLGLPDASGDAALLAMLDVLLSGLRPPRAPAAAAAPTLHSGGKWQR